MAGSTCGRQRGKRPSTVEVKKGHHRLIKWLFDEWERRRVEEAALKNETSKGKPAVTGSLSAASLAGKAGVTKNMIWLWRSGTCPKLDTFDAVIGVFGYRLTVEKIEEGDKD